MTYTTRTQEFDEITFTARGAYVWAQFEGQDRQICHGGDFKGSTVTVDRNDDGAQLKAAAQAWLRQRRNWMRKEGLV